DWRAALADGEDYELCFAAEGEVPAGLGDLPVTAVGRVVERSDLNGSLVCVRDGDRLIDAAELGWEHAG
ncbi:MAG: hypothetical protein ACYSXF_12200, partial [Planctomycetota bacterium]